MKKLKRDILFGILFVLITGSAAHFLYDWLGQNDIVGFFAPINESVWEHMKLLFFPMVIYALFMILKSKENRLCIASSFCFGILVGTWLIPVFYYAYHYIIGKDFFILDIGTFILSTIIAFWLAYKLSLSCRLKSAAPLLAGLVFILFLCFVLFTYHPPDCKIFQDPTVYRS